MKKGEESFTPSSFEQFARHSMGEYFGKIFSPGRLDDWPKLFDMVSEDFHIIGDAKYYSMVRGKYIPPAKFSVISEHVWMLEKIDATTRFLVFGNDIRVPEEWLKRYGNYVENVSFYFLYPSGKISRLL